MSDHKVERWTHPPNYAGAHWDHFYSAGFGQSRDSAAFERVNFDTVKRALAPLSTNCPDCGKGHGMASDKCATCNDFDQTVIVVRESHWAVGWIEWIAIHESNTAALAEARELCESANDYPSLDADRLSEVEDNEASAYWTQCDRRERLDWIKRATPPHWGKTPYLDALKSYGEISDRTRDYLRDHLH